MLALHARDAQPSFTVRRFRTSRDKEPCRPHWCIYTPMNVAYVISQPRSCSKCRGLYTYMPAKTLEGLKHVLLLGTAGSVAKTRKEWHGCCTFWGDKRTNIPVVWAFLEMKIETCNVSMLMCEVPHQSDWKRLRSFGYTPCNTAPESDQVSGTYWANTISICKVGSPSVIGRRTLRHVT